MDSFLEYAKSPSVWIGVVIGVLGSLVAAYLKQWIDRLGGGLSRRWAERSEATAAARNRLIERLRANPYDQQIWGLDSLNDKIDGRVFIVVGWAVNAAWGQSFAPFYWAAMITIAGGGWLIGASHWRQGVIRAARRPPRMTQ